MAEESSDVGTNEAHLQLIEGRIHTVGDRLVTWLIVGNGAALVLFYTAAINGAVVINAGARIVAGVLTIGLISGFLGCYQMVRGYSARRKVAHGRLSGKDAEVEVTKIAWWATGLFLVAAICFIIGVVSPVLGILTLSPNADA